MPRKKSTTPKKKAPSSRQRGGEKSLASRQAVTRRRKPNWQQEIAYYMRTTHLLIPRLSFCRVAHSVLQDMGTSDMRWQKAALDCLQEAAEAYMVNFLSEANLLAHHAKRVTLMPNDLRLLKLLKE